jgi:hypothetical protein
MLFVSDRRAHIARNIEDDQVGQLVEAISR